VKPVADFWRRYRRNRAAVGGLIAVLLIVLLAVIGPRVYEVNAFDMVGRPHLPPGGEFPLGTDVSGRDILAGIIHGAPVSLLIGVVASLCATIFGVAFGAVAG
jgi:peptide/nickel transport system permease protein